MLEQLSRTKRNLWLIAVGVAAAWAGWQIRAVLNPLILGYLLAFILRPAVEGLQRRGMRRSGAVLSVFGLAFLGALLLGLGVLYQGRVAIDALAREAIAAEQGEAPGGGGPSEGARPGGDRDAPASENGPATDSGGASEEVAATEPTGSERLESLRAWLETQLGSEWVPPSLSFTDLGALFRESAEARQVAGRAGVAAASSLWGGLTRFFGGVFGLSTLLVMVPVYAFFWLFEMGRLNHYVRDHIPTRHRGRFVSLFERMGEVLSVFFRGRLVVCLIKGLFLTVALVLIDVPYALLLGLGGGFLSIVPFLGGIVAFVAALGVALSAHGLVYATVATGLVFGAAELLEGYVLMPRILGDSLGLTDVTVLFALTAGGALLGLLGVLIALPVAAVIKILYLEFVEPALEQFVEEEGDEPAADGA